MKKIRTQSNITLYLIQTVLFLNFILVGIAQAHGHAGGKTTQPKETQKTEKNSEKNKEPEMEGSGGRGAYDPPTSNGVVRPGGYIAYDPPTSNGVVRPGGYTAYDPPTANGVVRPGN